MIQSIAHEDYSISVRAEGSENDHAVLFCNGGGVNVIKQRFYTHQDSLQKHGVGSVNFEYRGTGVTGGTFADSSLEKRIQEGIAVIDWYETTYGSLKSWGIYGPSMGAYIALGIAHRIGSRVTKLVLCAPAAYAPEAQNATFGPVFTSIISRPQSHIDSLSFEWIRSFEGETLLLLPELDEVVPKDVFHTYIKQANPTRTKIHWIPDSTHFMWKTGVEQRLIPTVVAFVTQ